MPSGNPRGGASASRPSWRRRVLVVEDSPDLWELIETFSRRLDPGLVIDFCDGPEEAEQRLKQGEHYDVLISDYCLPKPGDGEILRTRIKRSHPETSFGMISGLLGFKPKDVPYLRKPFTQNDFRGFLSGLLP
ncbi:MAG: response regulator [Myxococcota bacterium]